MSRLTRLFRGLRETGPDDFPSAGFTEHRVTTPLVESMTDGELAELNSLLRWHCFTVDSGGRRFGRRSKAGKRDQPQPVPDPRIEEFDRRFRISGKSVLEVGCFEGVHTVGLARLGAKVTAIDSRVENVVKTIVRVAMFGCQAAVSKCDVEIDGDADRLRSVDLLHHVGVLYHLVDPVKHLQRLAALTTEAVMLDTHYAEADQATSRYKVDGREVPYRHLGEGGRQEVFSGMYDHAKWLTIDTIREILTGEGFAHIDIAETRAERNGPRLLLFASK